ncbi:hypothetical protein PIB30_100052 [Stylosanthes scabra]|uniref:Chalcone-flavonone isomerase family protein n=1 Tax=Stylosanthes scabra TaxID=79078 RepID=A0ABU6YXC5_9FABA|nr:hypothetical protein [Stylosanthes scabra]
MACCFLASSSALFIASVAIVNSRVYLSRRSSRAASNCWMVWFLGSTSFSGSAIPTDGANVKLKLQGVRGGTIIGLIHTNTSYQKMETRIIPDEDMAVAATTKKVAEIFFEYLSEMYLQFGLTLLSDIFICASV